MGRKLTYIKSTGTQYIDTGIYPTANTKFVLDMAYNDVSGTRYSGLNISNSWFMFGENTYHEAYLGNKVVVFSTAASTERTTIVLDAQNKTATIGDETNSVAYTTFATPSVTLPLFAYRDASTWNGFASFKLYSCQIYDNDVLVRDFVPWENDDGEIGLYDKVNSVFYGDAAGGAFEAGEYDVAMVSHTFKGLRDETEYYARIFPVNPDGAMQSELDGQVASATTTGALTLSQLNEGDVVMIEENGTDVAFYLAKHDYESGLNGAGRTLMVRKNIYDNRAWDYTQYDADTVNKYDISDISMWLNSDYKALLDSAVQEAIGETKFYYTPGNQNTTVTTLSRSVFLLSLTELGESKSYANVEGSALPIASTLQTEGQWTRTPRTDSTTSVCYVNGAQVASMNCHYDSYGSRPSFTLPGDMKVSGTPNADGSYNLVTFPSEPTEYILTDTITASQTWTAPADGYYQVEAFGASGNGGGAKMGVYSTTSDGDLYQTYWCSGSGGGGGSGGYSQSVFKLKAGDTLVITVGATTSVVVNNTTDESYDTMNITKGANGTAATYTQQEDEYSAGYMKPGSGGAGGTASGGNITNTNGKSGSNGTRDIGIDASESDYPNVSGGAGGSAVNGGNAGGKGGSVQYEKLVAPGSGKSGFIKIYAGDTNAA